MKTLEQAVKEYRWKLDASWKEIKLASMLDVLDDYEKELAKERFRRRVTPKPL